ncbi:MAG: CubicO group peptidase (beta-lactamase class C family) [Cyclobacteriaceae bacterium]|jgi:CubicO group peptidase (beta-lactamase class C family)
MRVLATIISLISMLHIYGADKLSSSEVDSIYAYLSPIEKLKRVVWWKVDSKHASLPSEKVNGEIGAIYLPRPLTAYESMIFGNGTMAPFAVQLDERLNPSPENLNNLPSLVTLSSITDPSIVAEYAIYLEKLCRSYHLDFAILPKVGKDYIQMSQLVSSLNALNPDFFLLYEALSFCELKKKKEVEEAYLKNKFLVINDESLASIDKYLPRVLKKINIEDHIQKVRLSIKSKYNFTNYPYPILSGKLDLQINRASIIPVQRKNSLLPLKEDTVCVVSSDPSNQLVRMIKKYAYVISDVNEIINPKTPIIIENDNVLPTNMGDHDVVYIGHIKYSAKFIEHIDAGLFTTRESPLYDYLLPQLLFGTANASGQIAVNQGEWSSFSNEPIIGKAKLGYAPPEMIGLDSGNQSKIKQIVKDAIESHAIPGCQIAVSVDGSIVYEESFGYLTYDSLISVTDRTIYDIASVTKVAATLLAVMKLNQEGKLHLDSGIATYLPKYKETNKANVTLRALLSHNAGLKPYVPFWKKVIGADRLETFYYSNDEDARNDKRSYGLNPSLVLVDSLKNWIRRSPIREQKDGPKYVYSDIGFMVLHQIVEAVIEEPIDKYLNENFYKPLALKSTQFNPMSHGVDRFEIAPTEYDYYFRNEQVWGEVHDRNAAVFGGVAGHAGLFSNSHDLLVIMQMLLQEGEYNGNEFLKSWVIDYFNHRYYPNNRRGLGWDKKSDQIGNTSNYVSDDSYGHTGFTGTMIWIDPMYDLSFVFLSNRIYPNANNYRLNRDNVRTRIQDVVYEAMLSKWSN